MNATSTLRNALDALTSNADAGALKGLYADGDAPTNFSATVNELERRKRISESVKAVNDALAPSGASILLQAFIHAHIGLSEGRKEYRVPDIRLGEAMHKGTAADDETDAEIIERSNTSLRKLAQRGRTHAQRFYEQTGIRLLEVIEHGHQEGAKNIATFYRLHVWTLIEKVAQARPRERRKLAFKLLEEMREQRELAPQPFELTPEQTEQQEKLRATNELNRSRATVLTHTRKMTEMIEENGGNPRKFIEKLALEMLEECRKSEGRPIPKMAQVETTATNKNAVNKNHFVGKKPNSALALPAPALTLPAPALSTLKDKIVDTPRQMETHPPNSSSAAATQAAKAEPRASKVIGGCASTSSASGISGLEIAIKTVDCFARVGVDSFDVNFLRELKDESKLADTWKTYSAIGLRDALPELLKRSEARKQSLDVRITDKRLLFVDDLNLETVKLLYGHVVIAYCTSPDSYHAWLAFDTSEERGAACDRLLSKLKEKTSAANKGSGGKFRLPGSRNFKLVHKPKDFPRIVATNTPARRTSLDALDVAGLLAPEAKPEEPTRASSRRSSKKRPRTFPSYERCKADCKTRRKDGSPDLSVADKDWCVLALGRGWMRADVEAEFRKLREKARLRPDYVRSTLDYAERVVSNP